MTMYHVGLSKQSVKNLVIRHGPDILEPAPANRAEALAILDDDPREWFSGCPDADPDGKCPGHPSDQFPT